MNETCQKCGGRCCMVLCFPAISRMQIEHTKARGGYIAEGYAFFRSLCPNLEGGLCKIEAKKPLWCKAWPVGNSICKACQKIPQEWFVVKK